MKKGIDSNHADSKRMLALDCFWKMIMHERHLASQLMSFLPLSIVLLFFSFILVICIETSCILHFTWESWQTVRLKFCKRTFIHTTARLSTHYTTTIHHILSKRLLYAYYATAIDTLFYYDTDIYALLALLSTQYSTSIDTLIYTL